MPAKGKPAKLGKSESSPKLKHGKKSPLRVPGIGSPESPAKTPPMDAVLNERFPSPLPSKIDKFQKFNVDEGFPAALPARPGSPLPLKRLPPPGRGGLEMIVEGDKPAKSKESRKAPLMAGAFVRTPSMSNIGRTGSANRKADELWGGLRARKRELSLSHVFTKKLAENLAAATVQAQAGSGSGFGDVFELDDAELQQSSVAAGPMRGGDSAKSNTSDANFPLTKMESRVSSSGTATTSRSSSFSRVGSSGSDSDARSLASSRSATSSVASARGGTKARTGGKSKHSKKRKTEKKAVSLMKTLLRLETKKGTGGDAGLRSVLQRCGRWLPGLTDEQLAMVCASSHLVKREKGQSIFSEGYCGPPAMSMMVLIFGAVSGVGMGPGKKGAQTLFLTSDPGAVFGEASLFDGSPREYTLTAVSPATLLEIKKEHFVELFPNFTNLVARAAEDSLRKIRAALGVMGASLFVELLTTAELEKVAASAEIEWLHTGQVMFREGEQSSDIKTAFVVIQGAIDVTVSAHDGSAKARRKFVATFSAPGTILGEQALLEPGKRQAMAKVTTETAVVVLSRSDVDAVVDARPEIRDAFRRILTCEGFNDNFSPVLVEHSPGSPAEPGGRLVEPEGLSGMTVGHVEEITGWPLPPIAIQGKQLAPGHQGVGGLLGAALSRVQTVHDSHLPLFLVYFRWEQKKRVVAECARIGMDCMQKLERVFLETTTTQGWKRVFNSVTAQLQHAQDFFVKISHLVKLLPITLGPEGAKFTYFSLEQAQLRLAQFRAKLAECDPTALITAEKAFRVDAKKRILATPTQFAQDLYVRHGERIRDMVMLCELVEELPKLAERNDKNVSAILPQLAQQYGTPSAEKLFDSLYAWFERKTEAWDAWQSLQEETFVVASRLKELRQKVKQFDALIELYNERRIVKQQADGDVSPSKESKRPKTPPNVGLEAKPIRNSVQEEEVERYESLMERQRDNAAIRGRMAHDLDTINNKVCAAATADLPEPPASALDERPMLRLVLTLQEALEMREDHRLCKAMAARNANKIMTETLKGAGISKTHEAMFKKAGMDSYIPRDESGHRGIAPSMEPFANSLGDWLFSTDGSRWEVQARRERDAEMNAAKNRRVPP